MINVSKYFITDKIKILWYIQSLKSNLTIQWFTHISDNKVITLNQVTYLKFEQFLLNLIIDLVSRWLIVYEKFNAIHSKNWLKS